MLIQQGETLSQFSLSKLHILKVCKGNFWGICYIKCLCCFSANVGVTEGRQIAEEFGNNFTWPNDNRLLKLFWHQADTFSEILRLSTVKRWKQFKRKSIHSSNYGTGNWPKLKVLQRVLTESAITCSQLTPSHLILTHFSTSGNLYSALVILLINLDTIIQQSFHEFFLLHKDPFFVYIYIYI